MNTPQFTVDDQIAGYGLGVGVSRWHGATLISHNGGGAGFHTWQGWVPQHQVGVVVLANALNLTDFTPDEIARRAIAGMVEVTRGPLPDDQPIGPWKTPGRSVSPDDLRRLEGTYSVGGAASLPASLATFRVEQGTLVYARAVGPFVGGAGTPARLTPHSPIEFVSEAARFRFFLDQTGQVAGVLVQDRVTTDTIYLPFNDRPDDSAGTDKPAWQAYAGTYAGKVVGAGGTIPIRATVAIKNGHVYVGWGVPLKAAEHAPGVFFRSDGEAVRFEAGRMWIGNRPFVRINNLPATR